jgi:hypothetical protein
MASFDQDLRIDQISIIERDDTKRQAEFSASFSNWKTQLDTLREECSASLSFSNWKTQLDTLREECISLVYLLSKAKQGIISSIEDNLGDHVIEIFKRERDHLFVEIEELLLRIEERLSADLKGWENWEKQLDSLIDRMYSDVKLKIKVSIEKNMGDDVVNSYKRQHDHLWMGIEDILWPAAIISHKMVAAYEILEEIRRFKTFELIRF